MKKTLPFLNLASGWCHSVCSSSSFFTIHCIKQTSSFYVFPDIRAKRKLGKMWVCDVTIELRLCVSDKAKIIYIWIEIKWLSTFVLCVGCNSRQTLSYNACLMGMYDEICIIGKAERKIILKIAVWWCVVCMQKYRIWCIYNEKRKIFFLFVCIWIVSSCRYHCYVWQTVADVRTIALSSLYLTFF